MKKILKKNKNRSKTRHYKSGGKQYEIFKKNRNRKNLK